MRQSRVGEILAVATIVLLASGPSASAKNPRDAVQKPSQFIKEATAGGIAEVELGRLAVERASSPEVKSFGQRMVDDHSKANQDLKAVALRKKVAIPEALDSKATAERDHLASLSGTQFDRAYMEAMVKSQAGHRGVSPGSKVDRQGCKSVRAAETTDARGPSQVSRAD